MPKSLGNAIIEAMGQKEFDYRSVYDIEAKRFNFDFASEVDFNNFFVFDETLDFYDNNKADLVQFVQQYAEDNQYKSAGSFIPNLSMYYTNFDLNDGGENTNSNIFLASLAPSYFYNFVVNNHFLLSGGMSTGAGLTSVDGDVSAIYEWSASLKIGYNSDSFFTFVNLNYIDFIQDTTAQIRLNDEISTVKITAGYRFDPPKKVKEFYDKTTEKIGL